MERAEADKRNPDPTRPSTGRPPTPASVAPANGFSPAPASRVVGPGEEPRRDQRVDHWIPLMLLKVDPYEAGGDR